MKELRLKKIESIVFRELADLFAAIARDNFPGTLVSVSGVNVTPDLSIAKVYISIFPKDREEAIFSEIEYYGKEIRYGFAQRVRHQLRKIPELRFFKDDSLDRVERIEKLLEKEKEQLKKDNNNPKNTEL